MKDILGTPNMEISANPGCRDTWEAFCDLTNPPIQLPTAVEDLLKGLKLDPAHPAGETLISFLKKHKPPGEKTQHFLGSVVA